MKLMMPEPAESELSASIQAETDSPSLPGPQGRKLCWVHKGQSANGDLCKAGGTGAGNIIKTTFLRNIKLRLSVTLQ